MRARPRVPSELCTLVNAIGACDSWEKEEALLQREAAAVAVRFRAPAASAKRTTDLLLRTIYLQMLGREVESARVQAVLHCQSSDWRCKRVAYLVCGLCLPPEAQETVLLTNTLRRDLSSSDNAKVAVALSAIAHLSSLPLLTAVLSDIVRLLDCTTATLRKKAVCVLTVYSRLASDTNLLPHFRKALQDKDPSVMAASLPYFEEQSANPTTRAVLATFTPLFAAILKQVLEHRLPRDYDYQRTPAPWVQLRILRIMSNLCAGGTASESVRNILGDTLRRAGEMRSNIACAIVYQSIITIGRICTSGELVEKSAQYIGQFLSAESPELRYAGVCALSEIPCPQAVKYLLDCLGDVDDVIRIKALTLLCRLGTKDNAEELTARLLTSLASTADVQTVTLLVDLAEKRATDVCWCIRTLNAVIEFAPGHMHSGVPARVIRAIQACRDSSEIAAFAVHEYMAKLWSEEAGDAMVQLGAWVLGEFAKDTLQHRRSDIVKRLCGAMQRRSLSDCTKGWVLSALMKLSAGEALSEDVRSTIRSFLSSRNEDLQQRCYEFQAFFALSTTTFPLTNAFAEEFDPAVLLQICTKQVNPSTSSVAFKAKCQSSQQIFSLANAQIPLQRYGKESASLALSAELPKVDCLF